MSDSSLPLASVAVGIPPNASGGERVHRAGALVDRFRKLHGRNPEALAFAPGRIEVIGNHNDYNGGPVIGVAIDRGVWVAAAKRADRRASFRTATAGHGVVELRLQGALRKQVSPTAAWANYPLGVLQALQERVGLALPMGFDFLAAADLPAGAGLSSSAAIELASALVFLQLAGRQCTRTELALIGRQAENNFVGVPCGVLDQGVSAFGRADRAVWIDCARMVVQLLPLRSGLEFWVFNTHTKHALIDGLYAERHRECLKAAAVLGVPALARVTVEQLAAEEFRLSPLLRARTLHIVSEVERVDQAAGALIRGDAQCLGRLMFESHDSSRLNFQNSTPELDMLVEYLREVPGVLGARLTGGGFGGAVLALATAEFQRSSAARVEQAYERRFGGRLESMRLCAGDGAQSWPL